VQRSNPRFRSTLVGLKLGATIMTDLGTDHSDGFSSKQVKTQTAAYLWRAPAGRALAPPRAAARLGLRVRSLAQDELTPSPGIAGPASPPAAGYAVAPCGALLTGLGACEWSPLRSRPYALVRLREDRGCAGTLADESVSYPTSCDSLSSSASGTSRASRSLPAAATSHPGTPQAVDQVPGRRARSSAALTFC